MWLGRLFRRGGGREDELEGEPVAAAAVAVAEPEPAPRFSVWDRLADDPAAQALRAQWEARWDEF